MVHVTTTQCYGSIIGLEEVFSTTLALELAPLGVVSEALEMTWSLLEAIRAHWR